MHHVSQPFVADKDLYHLFPHFPYLAHKFIASMILTLLFDPHKWREQKTLHPISVFSVSLRWFVEKHVQPCFGPFFAVLRLSYLQSPRQCSTGLYSNLLPFLVKYNLIFFSFYYFYVFNGYILLSSALCYFENFLFFFFRP